MGAQNRKIVNCNVDLSEKLNVSPPVCFSLFWHLVIDLEISLFQNQLVLLAQWFILLTVGLLVGGAV